MLVIINDILDFSKIEAGKLDMEAVEFDLSAILDNVANVITIPTMTWPFSCEPGRWLKRRPD